MSPSSPRAPHPLGGVTLIILTEDGDDVPGQDSDTSPSQPAEPAGAQPTAAARPRIVRRPPSTEPVLPSVTGDERDVGWGEAPEPDDDERLLREVPPHHGS